MKWPFKKPKVVGDLRIDRSDPEEPPYVFLELAVPPETLEHESYITMRVVKKNYLSQK